MTELDKQAADFAALRAKRLAKQGPTNSAATIKPAKTMGFNARRATHRARISAGQLEASKARVAEAQAALEARKELAAKQTAAREAKTRLAAAQAALAESARQESATSKPSAAMTAAEFAGKPLQMSREEFRKLSAHNRARYVSQGGKITD